MKHPMRVSIGLGVAGALATLAIPAGAASGVTGQTIMKGRGDSGDAGNYWAIDSFTRVLTVNGGAAAPASDCGGHSGCKAYTASVADGGPLNPGGFTTVVGELAPNQSGSHAGQVITRKVSGTFSGFITYGTFWSTGSPAASNIPSLAIGNGVPSSDWPTLAFPAGTVFYGGPSVTDFGYTYHTSQTSPDQMWTDAINQDSGQITG